MDDDEGVLLLLLATCLDVLRSACMDDDEGVLLS